MPLLLLFIAVPLLEIALFIQLGSVLDLGWILLIVVLTAILGTWLVRRQGRGVLRQIQGSLETLRDPTEPLAHGAMILFSGALLLTPGFFTDTIGFLLLVPAVREAAFRWLRKRVVVHTSGAGMGARAGVHPHSPKGRPGHRAAGRPDVIEGDYEELAPDEGEGARGGEHRPRRQGNERPSGWTQD
ncbi:MAG: FxsA family protein [Paracoccaceae bacterium]|jgi:UPF0716 protein FxsA|nr:FxsA family protein [Paracoccaceae bacterium]